MTDTPFDIETVVFLFCVLFAGFFSGYLVGKTRRKSKEKSRRPRSPKPHAEG
ncbi:hypothetical protein Niako_3105 [Niastella koreensis GR20-10]|uniref:Uncharacterized protein n=1 Tax=Niastella koreensis (strain DSM 17620 / KACC 11465 / NBRC 106392 / GR20-10) TaxID=700598 RepID=G8TEL3_NIAKG|nr:hypothetical protein [Niastella koreensis]AEV99435.1 hypothetical protein Niako_3105 [Niastella koreensis GR20-10]